MVLPDLHNPIFPAYAEAMSGALLRRALVPVLCTRTSETVSEPQYIGMLLARHACGIVFVGSSYADAGPEQVAALRRRRLPVVLINAADEPVGVARFGVDDALAVQLAMGHLTALGHRRIGLVAGPSHHLPSARKAAAFGSDLVIRTEFSTR